MKHQRILIQSAVVALGAGLAQSQSKRIASKDLKPLVVGVSAAVSAALGHYAAKKLSKGALISLSDLTLSERDAMISDVVSAGIVGALASYVADRSSQSQAVRVGGVALASALAVPLGREVARRVAGKGPGPANAPVGPGQCKQCPDGFNLREGICVSTIPGAPPVPAKDCPLGPGSNTPIEPPHM